MASGPDPILWDDDGQPRSRAFGDVYFSADDGLAETRAVFLQGCGMPDAWAGRRRFVVAELGFGTGLNIAALLDVWRRTRPAEGQLHIFSIEAFPIAAADARRALSRWPELAPVTDLLLDRWPGRARGMHRVELPELSAILDLAVMDAREALAGWSGAADAWFLDGFAPALNPGMWSDEVLGLVGSRSVPGARAATFTVAGQARRGLAAAGFAVEKRPGHGRKRERLEARFPGERVEARQPSVAVIGAGIAGASLARAFRALGGEATLVDAVGPGAGASGNPGALVTPRLDAGLGEASRFYAQVFGRATSLYEALPQAILARGVLQVALTERDAARFAKLAASDVFEPGALALLSPDDAAVRLGEPAPAALDQTTALVIEPRAALEAWIGPLVTATAAQVLRRDGGWAVLDAGGEEIVRADAVVLAAGRACADFATLPRLDIYRGQASVADIPLDGAAAAWGGYVLPTRSGLLFGATYDLGDDGRDVRAEDHLRNLESLARGRPELAARLDPAALSGRASARAVTPDRLPLAGAAGADGLFVLAGFGARGFTFAPQLAEHVAALAFGVPSPLTAAQAAMVAPERFNHRAHSSGRQTEL